MSVDTYYDEKERCCAATTVSVVQSSRTFLRVVRCVSFNLTPLAHRSVGRVRMLLRVCLVVGVCLFAIVWLCIRLYVCVSVVSASKPWQEKKNHSHYTPI